MIALLLLAAGVALYEAPPGGCQIPPDFHEPVSPPPKCAPPPVPPVEVSAERSWEEHHSAEEELARELYEKQSEEYLHDSEDWDSIEQEYRREMFLRSMLQKIAASLTIAFVCWLIWSRFTQLRNQRVEQARQAAASSAADTDSSAPSAAETAPAPLPAASSDPAATSASKKTSPAAGANDVAGEPAQSKDG